MANDIDKRAAETAARQGAATQVDALIYAANGHHCATNSGENCWPYLTGTLKAKANATQNGVLYLSGIAAEAITRIPTVDLKPKLIRDGIENIIRATGVEPQVRQAQGAEVRKYRRRKLLEEVLEFIDSGQAWELADVIEAVYANAADIGITRADLENLRQEKWQERGGFDNNTLWLGNKPTR